MKIEQIYTGCLSQGSYYIESEGEVAIIDPLREVSPYIDRVKGDGHKIKYVFETHFHADFVSGHVSLAEKTGAKIIYGPNADPSFNAHIAHDLEEFKLGELTFIALHTPGHTMESTTYLLKNGEGKDVALFTGDTLFLGDVGRPDLAQKGEDVTQEDLAGLLYDSLRTKIMPLADDIMVYPAHGAGSACGKHMMKETQDTLGNQKAMNYALREDMTKEEFIAEVTDGLAPPPAYFPLNVKLNKEGYEDIDTVIETGIRPLSPATFELLASESGALMLDVRKPQEFAKGHVPNSIFIGLDGSFAPWVGELIVDINQPILLITPEGREEEAVTRLARVGFDQTLGFLEGGVEAWEKLGNQLERVESIPATDLASRYPDIKERIFDVRKESEFSKARIVEAKNTPLSTINNYMSEYPNEEDFYVHCAGGYRSIIACSILKSRGVHNLIDVQGGFGSIKKTDIAISNKEMTNI